MIPKEEAPMTRWIFCVLGCLALGTSLVAQAADVPETASAATAPTPIVLGETFQVPSEALGETRVINVYRPGSVAEDERLPVLYMPDGGMQEDFLHIAGLVQISVLNGTMRPFLLVGIENTERRRDLTGPTAKKKDKKIAPRVGGSAAFRQFIRDELMPIIRERYPTTKETAIVGESLAGLFVVECLLREPALFDSYIAVDPSLWWNDQRLAKDAVQMLASHTGSPKTLYLAASDAEDIAGVTQRLAEALRQGAARQVALHFQPMPDQKHHTIFHPAATDAFRKVFPGPRAQ